MQLDCNGVLVEGCVARTYEAFPLPCTMWGVQIRRLIEHIGMESQPPQWGGS